MLQTPHKHSFCGGFDPTLKFPHHHVGCSTLAILSLKATGVLKTLAAKGKPQQLFPALSYSQHQAPIQSEVIPTGGQRLCTCTFLQPQQEDWV